MGKSVDTNENNKIKVLYYRYLWWPWQLFLVAAAVFFVIFGLGVLVYAYQLNDPFIFVMTFFSASLIILLSLVMTIGFVYRIIRVCRVQEKKQETD